MIYIFSNFTLISTDVFSCAVVLLASLLFLFIEMFLLPTHSWPLTKGQEGRSGLTPETSVTCWSWQTHAVQSNFAKNSFNFVLNSSGELGVFGDTKYVRLNSKEN